MKPQSGKGMRLAYLLLSLASFCLATPLWKDRDALMQEEKSHQTGGNLVLSRQEQQLSTKLVNLKKEEVAAAVARGAFPPSMHFFRARSLIDQSSVFSILKRMPKGAVLHLHDYAMLSVDWLVYNATYLPDCYICFTDTGTVRFRFSKPHPPRPVPAQCSQWVLLETYRRQLHNVTDFDSRMKSSVRELTPWLRLQGQFPWAIMAAQTAITFSSLSSDCLSSEKNRAVCVHCKGRKKKDQNLLQKQSTKALCSLYKTTLGEKKRG